MKKQMRFIPVTIVEESQLQATLDAFTDWDSKKVDMWEGDSTEGCFAAADINGVIYIDSEIHGQFNSNTDKALVIKMIQAAMDYKEPWQEYEEEFNYMPDSPSLDMKLYY